jgi:hypothetical protein
MKPSPTEFCLQLSQQCWVMANAACDALKMDFVQTSPSDLFGLIHKLRTLIEESHAIFAAKHIHSHDPVAWNRRIEKWQAGVVDCIDLLREHRMPEEQQCHMCGKNPTHAECGKRCHRCSCDLESTTRGY